MTTHDQNQGTMKKNTGASVQTPIQRAASAFWDILLAILPILLVQGWPDVFSKWLMLSGIPLLACRYQITRMSRQQ
jgi:hypothetical protein